ncbi:hypothetical protein [Clostridium sp. B9]|uniref:hypothetical protein n=1 Tax=Clostridium sp. B9 TaxID=3423224 RepID=UPI003D2F38EC
MSIVNRFSITARGAIIFTGNTLGLSNNNSDVGVFTTLDLTIQEKGFPKGTTYDWRENSSSAQLNIPAGSTILYAELQWGGSAFSGGDSVREFIDNPIIFNTPLGSNSIVSDSLTSQEFISSSTEFYSRSQDVTDLISGSGTYSVEGVPATIKGPNNTIGWTLGVIYENQSLPIRSMNIYAGIEAVSASLGDADINLGGFLANPIGSINARVLISAMEGEEQIGSDQVLIGPNNFSLVALSGPNNLVNNFFRSFINDGNSESSTVGNLDKSGSFGEMNPPDKPARYGWDITNVGANNFVNNQSFAVMRLKTQGDRYAVTLIGLQLDTVFVDFGDAPDTDIATQGPRNYRTLFLSNGPRHSLINQLIIGNKVTGENDAYENYDATGDDIKKVYKMMAHLFHL